MSLTKKQLKKLHQQDLAFVTDASQGELMRTPKVAQVILWVLLGMVTALIAWGYYSSIEEIVRG